MKGLSTIIDIVLELSLGLGVDIELSETKHSQNLGTYMPAYWHPVNFTLCSEPNDNRMINVNKVGLHVSIFETNHHHLGEGVGKTIASIIQISGTA